ncbi:MAG: protein BatD [Alphaproteobacteria bacterium]|nr:protein BatD [Alphaproteobacteria bacterium]
MVMRLVLLLALLWGGPVWAQTALAPGGARLMILHDHGNPVVSEMVRLTLRGEYDLTVSLEDLRFPDSDRYDWMQIDRDRWFKERIGGRMIQIFERDIALFAREAGTLTIPPVTHRLTHVTASGAREEVQVTSGPGRLTVRPFPGNGRPLAAAALVLTDELSAQPGRLQQDEVLTRRVTIEALGTLAHHLPPRPDLQKPWLISFTQPETRETIAAPQGPVSRVVWEWQLRPRTGEPGVLPAVAFPWFDTETRRVEVAAMKPIPFGFAGFGASFGARDAQGGHLAGVAALALGAATGLLIGLWGRVPMRLASLRRLRRSPHAAALEQAAASGNLLALRAAAQDQLSWQGQPIGRQHDLLRQLERWIYDPSAADADPQRWLAAFRRPGR